MAFDTPPPVQPDQQQPSMMSRFGQGAMAVGGVGAGIAGAMAKHKAIDLGLNVGLRHVPVLRNFMAPYYAAVSRAGLEAGMHGDRDVLPTFRRGLGSVSPSVTGLSDYESSRFLGQQAVSQMNARGMDTSHASLDSLLNDPEQLRSVTAQPSAHFDAQSPLSRNLGQAISNPEAGNHWFVNWLKSKGVGPDAQKYTTRTTAAINAVLGGFHGPISAIGTTMAGLPDSGSMSAINSNKINTLATMKAQMADKALTLAREGPRPGFVNGTLDRIYPHALRAADPAAHEVYQMAQDIPAARQHLSTQVGVAPDLSMPTKMLAQNQLDSGMNSLEQTIKHHAQTPLMEALYKDIPSAEPVLRPIVNGISDTIRPYLPSAQPAMTQEQYNSSRSALNDHPYNTNHPEAIPQAGPPANPQANRQAVSEHIAAQPMPTGQAIRPNLPQPQQAAPQAGQVIRPNMPSAGIGSMLKTPAPAMKPMSMPKAPMPSVKPMAAPKFNFKMPKFRL